MKIRAHAYTAIVLVAFAVNVCLTVKQMQDKRMQAEQKDG